MKGTLECILLLALPASGKSEVRRYIAGLAPEVCREELHMGPTVQLDDFPYVHMMRRIDDELASTGRPRLFFQSPEKPFGDPRDWGTLIHLLNEDYSDLLARMVRKPESAALLLLERIEEARRKTGAPARLAALDDAVRSSLARKIEDEAAGLLLDKQEGYPDSLEDKTLVFEFARGGPHGSSMPLPEPFGYRHSLSLLDPRILEKAAILYIWVTPEQSRRKNEARTDPNDPGSILHHGVPIDVMMNDYGCDDMDWLEKTSSKPGTVPVEAQGKTWHLPVARFDNRIDKTTFIRSDPGTWKKEDVDGVHGELKRALDLLWKQGEKRR
jgi:hypothetical protein